MSVLRHIPTAASGPAASGRIDSATGTSTERKRAPRGVGRVAKDDHHPTPGGRTGHAALGVEVCKHLMTGADLDVDATGVAHATRRSKTTKG